MSEGSNSTTAAAAAGFQTPLLAVMREALRNPMGRVALRVPAMPPHRRRVARALLQEGALAAGGVVLDGPNEELLLIGAEAGRAVRLRGLIDRLIGSQVTGLWSLERDAAALQAYATAAEAGAPGPTGTGPALACLDAWLRALPLERVVRRVTGMRLDPSGGPARPAFLRLSIGRQPLACLLGGLGRDADLLDHATRTLAARLLIAIGDPSQRRELMGSSLPGPLHLPVPPAPLSGRGDGGSGGGRGALVATLGLEMAANPAALQARRESLALQGWALELEGIDAAALRLLAIEALPADWLRITWSPALAAPAAMSALRRADPGRIILAGVCDDVALDWAGNCGLRLLEGPAAEAGPGLQVALPVSAALSAANFQPAAAPARPAA
ncbi:hypothetical protein [Falsiroseomonas sp. E2-1-a4]|uniref:hypothetical protein n=1 Tax=Falsiroseomonas sp. E2-1-a4 TaxID=3239299 RepID=UPI003F2BD9F8